MKVPQSHGELYSTVSTDETVESATSNLENQEGSENETLEARARAKAVLPELETYQWDDDYFNKSGHDIIAVFDHDAFATTMVMLLPFGIIWATAVIATPFVLIFGISFLSWLTWLVLMWGALRLSIAVVRRYTFCQRVPAHTAVTTKGVVHVEAGNGKGKLAAWYKRVLLNHWLISVIPGHCFYSLLRPVQWHTRGRRMLSSSRQ